MIAPATMDALADVAKALGFELRRTEHAVPVGIDYDRSRGETQFALLRESQVEFDGTARECAAFLIGWRTLRSSVLGSVRAIDARVMPEMSARTQCAASDEAGRRCLARAGHEGQHSALLRWNDR